MDEVLHTGLLVYLTPTWLAEVFHQVINTNLLKKAGFNSSEGIRSPVVQLLTGESPQLFSFRAELLPFSPVLSLILYLYLQILMVLEVGNKADRCSVPSGKTRKEMAEPHLR